MAATEFEIIECYFNRRVTPGRGVILGTGDDAAVLEVTPGQQLVVSTDTLVSGVHFFADDPPADLGHKSLAVNLSDLAAMGATPRWATLCLTLSDSDERWLGDFAEGFYALAERHEVTLVGGDMSRGPVSVTVQVMGTVPAGQALLRSGARPGDDVYVSGRLGMAALALAVLKGELPAQEAPTPDCLERLRRPIPRVGTGLCLRGIAASAIDISDGLAADLGHILEASGAGAEIRLADVPFAAGLESLDEEHRWRYALGGGDDYELCFTVAADRTKALQARLQGHDVPLTRIGKITPGSGVTWLAADGQPRDLNPTGYRHF